MMTQATASARIAHLSDLHLLETRRGPVTTAHSYDLGTRFVSIGRSLDPIGRRAKVERALARGKRAGASHFILSGDLTEMGTRDQFEELGEVLHESGIHPDRITLVPGNHDLYDSPKSWERAIEGPLRPWAHTCARKGGDAIDVGVATILPLDVTVHQHVTLAGGELDDATAAFLKRRAMDTSLQKKPFVVVQHHQPFPHCVGFMQWIDGLRGFAHVMGLLEKIPTMHVLHGHLHRIVSRVVGMGHPRILGAPATVDDPRGNPRVRLYEIHDGRLESTGFA